MAVGIINSSVTPYGGVSIGVLCIFIFLKKFVINSLNYF